MSFLKKMYAGEKGNKPSSTGDAIQELQQTEEMLIKEQDILEKKIEEEISITRKNVIKNKRGI
jgi:charged multivesicular body protein 4